MSCFEGKKTGVLVIAHGSRNAHANADLFALVQRFRGRGFSITEGSFLELAKPDVLEGGKSCVEQGAKIVVLLPYFLSAGIHVVEDLIELKQQLADLYTSVKFELAKPLGPHPLLEKILELRLEEVLENQA